MRVMTTPNVTMLPQPRIEIALFSLYPGGSGSCSASSGSRPKLDSAGSYAVLEGRKAPPALRVGTKVECMSALLGDDGYLESPNEYTLDACEKRRDDPIGVLYPIALEPARSPACSSRDCLSMRDCIQNGCATYLTPRAIAAVVLYQSKYHLPAGLRVPLSRIPRGAREGGRCAIGRVQMHMHGDPPRSRRAAWR